MFCCIPNLSPTENKIAIISRPCFTKNVTAPILSLYTLKAYLILRASLYSSFYIWSILLCEGIEYTSCWHNRSSYQIAYPKSSWVKSAYGMDLHTSFFLLHCLFLISVESNAMINAFVSQFYIKCTKDVFKAQRQWKTIRTHSVEMTQWNDIYRNIWATNEIPYSDFRGHN